MFDVYAKALGEGSPAQIYQLDSLFSGVISVAIGFAALVFFLLIIVGGFKFITSGGSPEKAEGAKNTLTWAVYGIVLVSIAFLIIQLISYFTGVDLIQRFTVFN